MIIYFVETFIDFNLSTRQCHNFIFFLLTDTLPIVVDEEKKESVDNSITYHCLKKLRLMMVDFTIVGDFF